MKPTPSHPRRYFLLPLAVALIVGLTILSGYVQGKMSRRWGISLDLVAMGKALDKFPDKIGPWQLVSTDKLSDDVVTMLECTGHVLRVYANPETGETVTFALLVGPSMPMVVHTPDICYSSQAYNRLDDPKQVKITGSGGEEGEFWTQTFKANDLQGELLRVYYGWLGGGAWRATENARFHLARYPYLYKIQVVTPLADSASDNDPAKNFLRDFLTVAKKELKEL